MQATKLETAKNGKEIRRNQFHLQIALGPRPWLGLLRSAVVGVGLKVHFEI